MASPTSPAGATSADSQAADETLAWLSRMEILILDRQHQYIRRMLELQLESAMSEADRCPDRVARARREARNALDRIRELLGSLHDSISQLPPQLRRAGRTRAVVNTLGGNRGAALAAIDSLPALKTTVAADCPICLASLSSLPEKCSGDGPVDHDDKLDVAIDVVALTCGGGAHRFHRDCIRQWVKLSARCPLCRQAVETRSDSSTPRDGQLAVMPSRPALPRPRSGPIAAGGNNWPSSAASPRTSLDVDGEMARLRAQSEGPRVGRSSAGGDDLLGHTRAVVGAEGDAYTRGFLAATAAGAEGRSAISHAAQEHVSRSLQNGVPSSSDLWIPAVDSHTTVHGIGMHAANSARSDISQRSASEHDVEHSAHALISVRSRSTSRGRQDDLRTPVRLPPRSPLRVGGLIVAQAARPSAEPTMANQSGSLEHGIMGSRRIPSRNSSAAALATAATGYGRALASAAIASAQRRASAAPVMPPTPISQQRVLGELPAESDSLHVHP